MSGRARHLLAVLLLLAATPSATGGSNLYIAFGDSITRATGAPAFPDNVFDSAPCSESKLDECACARRLTVDLGPDATVVNEGEGAERTDEGLARIDGVLTSRCPGAGPGDCIAVLLMEGTNNVTKINKGQGGYSIESTIQDLEAMIDVASSHGVDVLLGAVIQRGEWDGCTAIGHDATTDELNDEIEILAASKSRVFADIAQHNPKGLCRDSNTCFQNHYYCDDLHIESSGYDRLCDIFLEQIEGTALPGAPTPDAPDGTITTAQPDFEWADLSAARWYELEIDGESTWHDAGEAAICSGGDCAVAPVTLDEGEHSWRVRARNLLGYGPWSSSLDFAVYLTAPQAAPEPISPGAPVFETTPLYRWRETAGAESYAIDVEDSSQNVEVSVSGLLAADVCDDGVCSYRDGTALAVDTYGWSIRAANPLGDGPTSAALGFEVLPCTDESPRDAEQIAPSPVQGDVTVSWCGPLTAGALGAYVVEAGASLVLHSRDSVELLEGFESAGEIEVRVDE